jgi:hypothetical protein
MWGFTRDMVDSLAVQCPFGVHPAPDVMVKH